MMIGTATKPKYISLAMMIASAFILSGCGSDDNTSTPPTCATYMNSAAPPVAVTGEVMGANCMYPATFVDTATPLIADIEFASFSGGAHIFAGTLAIGATGVTAPVADADRTDVTIAAGATIAFSDASDGVVVNRGARLIATGSATSPITFTSDEGLGTTGGAAGQWAGVTINGLGVNNACTYTGGTRTFDGTNRFNVASNSPALTTTCDNGGITHADNSGSLGFVRIQNAGPATGAALTLTAVGSATAINSVQVSDSSGDGVALTGGSADITNLVVYNAVGTGVEVTSGYLGELTTVLVSQADTSGGRCLDVVGTGTAAQAAATVTSGLNTRVMVNGFTCDATPTAAPAMPAGAAAGSGVRIAAGADLALQNAVVVTSRVDVNAGADDDNVCLIAENAVAGQTTGAFTSAVFACADTIGGTTVNAAMFASNGQLTGTRAHFTSGMMDATATTPALTLLSAAGTMPARPLFSVPVAMMMVPSVEAAMLASEPGTRGFLGAIMDGGTNPFAGWTEGIFTSN